ncbi:MAG: polysaccharide biosynthesis C-terminal domain-containing protein [Clostridia bacterium]
MSEEKKQSFMQGIMTLMFSQVLIKILGLVYKMYLTNREGFGDSGNAIYSSGFQIYALLLTISSIGVPNAVAKLISEKLSVGDSRGAQKIFNVAFATFAIIGFLLSALLFFGSNFIANIWLQIPEAELTLTILAPSIFFVSLISVYRGYFNGYENMKPMAKSQTIEQLSKTVLTVVIVEAICFLVGTEGTVGIMAAGANLATTIATFICFVYLTVLYLRKRKADIGKTNKTYNKRTRTLEIIKNILIIAMPMTLSAILGSLNKNIDAVTVVRGLKNFLSEEQAQIQYGILSGKIDTLVTFPLSFNMAFATALVPAISAANAKGDMKSINKRLKFSILISILIGLPCCVGMIIFAEPILQILFPNASSGAFIFQISSLGIVFIMVEQNINGALQGLGKVKVPVIALFFGVIAKLLINLILVRINPEDFVLGGVAGAALGTVVCHIISMTISFVVLRKNIDLDFKISKFIIKPAIATVVMAILSLNIYKWIKCIIMQNIAILVTITFAVLIYVVIIFKIKVFDEEEINMLPFSKYLYKKRRILSKIGE